MITGRLMVSIPTSVVAMKTEITTTHSAHQRWLGPKMRLSMKSLSQGVMVRGSGAAVSSSHPS